MPQGHPHVILTLLHKPGTVNIYIILRAHPHINPRGLIQPEHEDLHGSLWRECRNMIIYFILQVILLLILLLIPGLLWARILLPNRWLREQVALAPGLSLAVLIPAAFLLWGPMGVPVGFLGALLVFLSCTLPALVILIVLNMKKVNPFIVNLSSSSYWRAIIRRAQKEIRKEHLILLGVVVFASILNFYPHFNYLHPLHTDEWHYIIRGQDLGDSRSFLEWARTYPETGYLAMIALISSFSGIAWFDMALILPTLFFSYAIVLFFVLGRKYGPGHMMIFPLLLIPTSVRYLGPVFLVPLALFLVTFPLALMIRYDNRLRSVIILPFLLIFSALIHPPSTIALFLVILIASIVRFQKEKKRGVAVICILVLLSLLIVIPMELWVNRLKWNLISEQGYFFLSPPSLSGYLEVIGLLMLFLALIGATHIIRTKSGLGIIAVISSLVLIIILWIFVFIFPNYNNVTALHDRILFCLIAVMTIPAGYGLWGLEHMDKRLAFSAIAVILIVSTSLHIQADYYHIVSNEEYDDFVWISENLNGTYGKAILDPWKAISFRAITGKSVYYSVPQGPSYGHETKMRQAVDFLDNDCADTSFLIRNNITIVYTNGPCSNPELVKVHERVYVLLS